MVIGMGLYLVLLATSQDRHEEMVGSCQDGLATPRKGGALAMPVLRALTGWTAGVKRDGLGSEQDRVGRDDNKE